MGGGASFSAIAALSACVAVIGPGCSSHAVPAPVDLCRVACGEGAYCDAEYAECYCEFGFSGDPNGGCEPQADVCAEAENRIGHSACELEVREEAIWTQLSIGHGKDAALSRAVKYLTPARADARLPPVFIDTNWYRIHHCFLAQAFEPQFPMTTYADYQDLVIDKDKREYFGGTISELSDPGPGEPRYVFTVETFPVIEDLLTQQEIYGVYRQLQDRFSIGELSYLARNPIYVAQAQRWTDPPFPVTITPEGIDQQYEAYTPGVAYGNVRRFTDTEFVQAGAAAFGWRDILVFESPPLVLEGVMAASVTTGRQDILTHLNVLSALRGTPNIQVANALSVFEPFEGELVRLEAFEDYYSIREARLDEAEAYWAQQRPAAELNAPPDRDYKNLVSLDDVPVDTAEARNQAVSRFGSKASGLAILRSVADTDHVVRGFGIPMGAYFEFMATNSWDAPVSGGTQTATYADTIELWLADEAFRSDAELRAARLDALRLEIVERGVVDPALLETIRTEVEQVFGNPNTMVRFRSSSNAEDSLSFNGAGLYDSVSGCGPDSATDLASACEPDRGTKPVDEALKRVWASLWYFGAYEEREFYQLDHREVGMGVLVNPRFADERANGVAFTGNPTDPADPRLTINVQLGEVPVVSATAGEVAELDRVLVEDGRVVSIDRESTSSIVAENTFVLSDEQLSVLALQLASIAQAYPIDARAPKGTTVMLDAEFKLTAARELVFKQIRPFAARPYVPGNGDCE